MEKTHDPYSDLDYSYNVTKAVNKDEIYMHQNFVYTDQSSSSESDIGEEEEE